MSTARIKFEGKEIELGDRIVTCGRAAENDISFVNDSNVSRFHAEIEKRGDGYWIIDLNSSNGTSVNGEPLYGDRPLSEGDQIVLGGTSEFEFTTADAASDGAEESLPDIGADPAANVPIEADIAAPAVAPVGGVATEADSVSEGSKSLLLIAGILCGVAVLCVLGGAAAFYFGSGSKCEATAKIVKPESGDTIANPTEIEVKAEDTGCVAKALFTLDGTEIASAEREPYSATLDPSQYPDLSDGLDHSLKIVLIDQDGQPIGQPSGVMLAFETREVEKPEATPDITRTSEQNSNGSKPTSVTLLDVQKMSLDLVKQFRGGFTYKISDKQFLQEIQRRTGEYAVEGYFNRAAAYRDAINVAYVREQNLDAPLGFILAMSRSKFVPSKQGDNEGLWQMSGPFVASNAYNGSCGGESLSDASQNCAAKASALYMKAIVYGVFDGDPVYSAAAFGKSPQEATAWKASLTADRSDIWKAIKSAPEREQLIRFFAAGIVAENPQRFGLKRDRPLDELYRVTM
jgi:hypothetical protein